MLFLKFRNQYKPIRPKIANALALSEHEPLIKCNYNLRMLNNQRLNFVIFTYVNQNLP